MFRSVFSKFVLAFAAIIFVSFAMLSALITAVFSSYATEERNGELSWAVDSAASLVEVWIADGDRETLSDFLAVSSEDVSSVLDRISENRSDLSLFLTDENGSVLIESGISVNEAFSVERAVLDEILRSEGPYLSEGTLGGVFENLSFYAAVPIENGEKVIGYAVSAVSNSAENAMIGALNRTIIMSSLWVMLAALVAAYFISDYMTKPLKNMVGASKKFAKGQFDERVPIVGKNEISELSAAFNDMAESLDNLEKMRNTFLSNVAHDLRTPMTSISGFIDGIKSGAIPPEKQDYYLDIISKEIHRLSRLVSQILELSRYESGKIKFTSSSFDICEMARLILISFEQKIEGKKLDVEFDADEDSLAVFADKDAIYQIFYNLCDNAIKFSNEGSAFRIKIVSLEGKVSVSVFNEGIGISKEDLPHVFDRFYKSDKSRGMDKTGFGIGLYIAKTVVDAHGERISVDSVEGEYCEFSFTLKKSKK